MSEFDCLLDRFFENPFNDAILEEIRARITETNGNTCQRDEDIMFSMSQLAVQINRCDLDLARQSRTLKRLGRHYAVLKNELEQRVIGSEILKASAD